MHRDARDHAVALSVPAALEPYERALRAFHTYRGDPLALLDEAIALDSGFAAAYATKALVLCTFFERRFMREALRTLEAGGTALQSATPRERLLAQAAGRIAGGDWLEGARALERVLVEHPRDIVALQTAHAMDFYRGDALNLRNRVSRVLPSWSASVPGYAYVLGMHAFGLEECNQYAEAERAGWRAIELSGDDCWAVHAVAHVMEMQGRSRDGLNWYEATRWAWDGADNGFAFHNDWHRALFLLDRGDHAGALAIYDRRFPAHGGDTVLPRIDATALLWRLRIEGADVGDRLAAVADGWTATLADEAGFYAFNDFHAALALAAAGRREALAKLRGGLERAERDNGATMRAVGLDLVEGAIAYCEGRYAAAIERIGAVRDAASRFGGSHAQRDLLSLTLIDAATRAGLPGLARHYANERIVHKPQSDWGRRLIARAEASVARAAA